MPINIHIVANANCIFLILFRNVFATIGNLHLIALFFKLFNDSLTRFIADAEDPARDRHLLAQNAVRAADGVIAAEDVQIYLQGTNCRVMRPVCELKGYRRIDLKAGESGHVSVPLESEAFCFYNARMEYGAFDGDYRVSVGTSCKNIVGTFNVRVRNGVLQQD